MVGAYAGGFAAEAQCPPTSPSLHPFSHPRTRTSIFTPPSLFPARADENMVHTEKGFMPESVAKADKLKVNKLSGTEFRRLLRGGHDIPEWFAFKSVVSVLKQSN